jgi:hypothetical protein
MFFIEEITSPIEAISSADNKCSQLTWHATLVIMCQNLKLAEKSERQKDAYI